MNLIPFRPTRPDERVLSPVERLHWEMDRMLDQLTGFDGGGLGQESALVAPIDVQETEDSYTIRADLPGVAPEDLHISITGSVLTLSGEKKDGRSRSEGGWHRTERRFGAFRRDLQLPSGIEPESASAEHKNGVVTIHLKKAPSARPRRIEIKASSTPPAPSTKR